MTKRLPKIKAGQRIITDAITFDRLCAANMIKQIGMDGPEGKQWSIFGIEHGDDKIECELWT